jgi:hypothetical protein
VIAPSPRERHLEVRITGLSDMTLKAKVSSTLTAKRQNAMSAKQRSKCSPVIGNGDSHQIAEELLVRLKNKQTSRS